MTAMSRTTSRTTPWDPSKCPHDAGRTRVETPDWIDVVCDKCGRVMSRRKK